MKIYTKSLVTKILLLIGIPIAIIYCAAGGIILNTVNHSVTDLTEKELSAKSQAAADEIGGVFANYMETAEQMAANTQFENLIRETVPGSNLMAMPDFPSAEKTLVNVQKTDPENILTSWIVDVDTDTLVLVQADGKAVQADGWSLSDQAWYKQMQDEQRIILSEPYKAAVSDAIIVSLMAPIYDGDTKNLIGVVGIDVNTDQLYQMIKARKLGKTGSYILVSKGDQVVYHPNDSFKNQSAEKIDVSENLRKAFREKDFGKIRFSNEGVDCHGYLSSIGDTGWMVATSMPDKEFTSAYRESRATIFIIFIFAVALIAALIVLLSKRIVKPLRTLASAVDRLSVGEVNVDVSNIAGSKDEIGELTKSFEKMIENIKHEALVAERIATGDLSVEITPHSENDLLAVSMVSMIKTLRKLTEETRRLTRAAVEGQLDERGSADLFEGGYKELIEGINQTLDAVIDPLKVSAACLEQISRGKIPPRITQEYQGDFNQIKNSLNTCIEAINALIEDSVMLSDAAVAGELGKRADVSRHGGDFSKIIWGLNETLSAVVGPLSKASEYIKKIGQGEIPQPITEEYAGDFNEIKESINNCIEGLSALVQGREILGNMSRNNYSLRMEGNYLGIYDEISKSINAVCDKVSDVIQVVNHVAEGSLEDLEALKAEGKRSEEDELTPSL
ncbi:MAG TPA: cache domain-containing protein, partial [Bacillota bacterium]|nr:cache domain-containing protein [Bacillota bacterium]